MFRFYILFSNHCGESSCLWQLTSGFLGLLYELPVALITAATALQRGRLKAACCTL